MKCEFKRYCKNATLIVFLFLLPVAALSSCSDDKDRGDGFRVTETKTTAETKPSKEPTLTQPCSLLSKAQAAEILGTTEEKLGDPESSTPADDTLRCRYDAISDDQKLYLVLNVYVYETQKAYDQVKKVNKGTDIETSVDEGFYYDLTSSRESERLVAARDGKSRVAVSSSIAVINADDELTPDQITLPSVNSLASQLGIILSKV